MGEIWDSLKRGLAFSTIGVIIWSLGLLIALDEVGIPKDQLLTKAVQSINSQIIFPVAFLLGFLLIWLRYVAPRRVNSGQLRWFAILALIAFLVLVGYLLGLSQSSNGLQWEPLAPLWKSFWWHATLSVPAIAYFARGRVMPSSSSKSTDEKGAIQEGVHLSFLYQIFAPSVLFCMSLFSMGVFTAASLGFGAELNLAWQMLGFGTALFAMLYWFVGSVGQGVGFYVPIVAMGLLLSFSASVVVDATWTKLLTASIALTFALGVAEVSKRYGQIASGKLTDYEHDDASYFLLGANWSSAVFPAFTLVMISTFQDYGFIATGAVVAIFVVSWLHMSVENKGSHKGERLAILYGVLLPISVGIGIVWGAPVNDWFGKDLEISDFILALLAQVAFSVGLLRLAKDTVGVPLDGFFLRLWSPSNYLYRPHCLFLLLTVNSLIVILLLLLFVALILFPAFAGSTDAIIELGKQLTNSGFIVTFISLLALMGTFATPDSVSRLRLERDGSVKSSTKKATDATTSTVRVSHFTDFIASGRPGVSWIAGAAVFATGLAQGSQSTVELTLAFVAMTLITMFGFVVNDISDREKDQVAGKKRPITTGKLPADIAALFAASALGVSMVIAHGFGLSAAVSAISIATALVFYSPFSRAFPLLKGPYTAVLCVTPFLFAATALNIALSIGILAVVFFFVVFRELVLDAEDAEGDMAFGIKTTAHLIGPRLSKLVGWSGMLVVLVLGQAALESSYASAVLVVAVIMLLLAMSLYSRKATLGLKLSRVPMLLGVCAAAIG